MINRVFSCPACGSKIEIVRGIDRFACSQCGNELVIHREKGIVFLEFYNQNANRPSHEKITSIPKPARSKKRSFVYGCIKYVGLALGVILGIVLILAIIISVKYPSRSNAPQLVVEKTKEIILVPSPTPLPTDTPAPTDKPTDIPTHIPPTPLPAFLARCLDVPEDKIHAIEIGLTVGGGGFIDAKTAQTVKAGGSSEVYFIAGAIYGAGMGDKGAIAVWASNDLGAGPVFTVDAMSVEFTDFAPASSKDGIYAEFYDGAQEAEDCVRYKQNHS